MINIESLIYGKRIHNLEINLPKIVIEENKKKLEKIAEYTGSFIVTEKGYLLGGHDNNLPEKIYATICNTEILPPTIIYEKGKEGTKEKKIVRNILGLRLAELNYQQERGNACCCRLSFA